MDNRCFENGVKPALLLIVLLLAAVASGQDKHKRIGEIDFYGYAGLDLNRIRVALPLREGDDFPDSNDVFFDTINRIREAVKRVIGKPPTDIAVVCSTPRARG